MAHYKSKGKSRLATRNSDTDREWLKVCSQIGSLVNEWARRNDLAVYGGEDSAEGRAVAAYYAEIAEIELNTTKAFYGCSPELVGDLRDKDVRYEFPMVSGIIYHEAMHARHTNWNVEYLAEQLDNTEGQAFMLLEEGRIEKKGVIERPENRLFLRESALQMALEDVNEETLSKMGSDTWQVAQLAGLALARYDSGVLQREDVAEIYKLVVATLGEELYGELRKVWVAFQNLGVPQIDEGIALAKKWVELLRQADPEGEPDSGNAFSEAEEGEGEGEGEQSESNAPSEAVKKLLEAMEDSASDTQIRNSSALAEQEQAENQQDEVKSKQEEAKNRNHKRQKAMEIMKHYTEGGSGSMSRVQERRSPTGAERASAVALSKALDKAKYRERSVHTRKTNLPMGKLSVRNAVQNRAMESMGLRGELPAWKQKVRKHTDDPTLKLGVMVDVSGSMGNAMEAMGQTAWILSEAGRRIQAETAMVYFGSGVFPTLRKGQRLDEVQIYNAPDGTEKFDEAWQAIDGELELTFGSGVRMVVIVSDGQFTGKESENAVRMLQECKRNGVAVLWITPKDCYGSPAGWRIKDGKWGIHLDQMEVAQIATEVGKSASEALAKVGSQM